MRTWYLVFALVMASGAQLGLAAAARAEEAALSYAPTTVRIPPLVVDGLKAHQHLDPPRGRVCYGQTETRERIAAQKLAEPLQALRTGRLQGDALRAKLCRWKPDEFVYEIAVLRHDGHIVHVYMNAQNGLRVGP